jgi:hypothetical protein
MTARLTWMAVAVMLALGSAACDEQLSEVAGPTPNLEPTLTSIQRDIFSAADRSGRPACTNCHRTGGPAAFLPLTDGAAYGSLVGRASSQRPGAIRVIPGDPEGSYLVQKLEGAPGITGQRMPFAGGPFLAEGQMRIIRRWIALGANND